jgi:flagellar motility protein MotE (MotC chaperone)
MTSVTSNLLGRFLVRTAFAFSLAFAAPVALRAQPAAQQPAQKSEKMARPDARIDSAAEKAGSAKALTTAKRQKLRDCSAKWQDEKKAKGLTGKAAYLKFLSACVKG